MMGAGGAAMPGQPECNGARGAGGRAARARALALMFRARDDVADWKMGRCARGGGCKFAHVGMPNMMFAAIPQVGGGRRRAGGARVRALPCAVPHPCTRAGVPGLLKRALHARLLPLRAQRRRQRDATFRVWDAGWRQYGRRRRRWWCVLASPALRARVTPPSPACGAVCRDNEMGRCFRGTACRFSHATGGAAGGAPMGMGGMGGMMGGGMGGYGMPGAMAAPGSVRADWPYQQ